MTPSIRWSRSRLVLSRFWVARLSRTNLGLVWQPARLSQALMDATHRGTEGTKRASCALQRRTWGSAVRCPKGWTFLRVICNPFSTIKFLYIGRKMNRSIFEPVFVGYLQGKGLMICHHLLYTKWVWQIWFCQSFFGEQLMGHLWTQFLTAKDALNMDSLRYWPQKTSVLAG